jgi:hypothetical protein
MALKMDYTANSGVTVKDAYFKVQTIEGNKTRINAVISVWKDEEASKSENIGVVGQLQVNFVPSDENRWDAQTYVHIKTLDDFSTAIDC